MVPAESTQICSPLVNALQFPFFLAGGAGFGVEALLYNPLSLSLGKDIENDKLSGEPQA